MKTKITLILFFSLLLNWNASAQRKAFKMEVNFATLTPSGTIADDFHSQFGFQSDVTVRRYTTKGIGVGFRLVSSEFYPDRRLYVGNLMEKLGSQDFANYSMQDFSITNTGFQLSFSYDLSLGKVLSIEPFLNAGMDILEIPAHELYYLKDNSSFLYRQDEYVTSGFSINPGLMVNIAINPYLGLQLFGSYSTSFMEEYYVREAVIGPTTIEATEKKVNIAPEFVSFGVGFSINLKKKTK